MSSTDQKLKLRRLFWDVLQEAMEPKQLNVPEAEIERIARRHGLDFHEARKLVERDPDLARQILQQTDETGPGLEERQQVNGVLDINGPEGVADDNNRFLGERVRQNEIFNERAAQNGESDLNGPEAVLSSEDIDFYNRLMREQRRENQVPQEQRPAPGSPAEVKQRDARSLRNKGSNRNRLVRDTGAAGRAELLFGGSTPKHGGLQAWRNRTGQNSRSDAAVPASEDGVKALPIQTTFGRGASVTRRDQQQVEGAMNTLGYLDNSYRNLTEGRVSAPLAGAIERFQSDNHLKPDGVMMPNGPTARRVQTALLRRRRAEGFTAAGGFSSQ